ncbi:TraB/GumN family protein [Alteromonas alba]|uniref:TraB/GumN family protein n=1 Tax=Alteromonas alba TaxID=2079529 RepID=A0A2S9V7R0_9ALTE|nr:TraB/GumN family protein [Alteromonas alba]PRO72506.1 TraB/GumN family protein [Alteromonas alba]
MLKHLCWLFLFTCSWAYAASVWQVSKAGNTVYIGGTLHILSPEDFPLPNAYGIAYNQADKLVFETDIAGLNSPRFQQDSRARLTYGDGTQLKDVLSNETYQALKAHLTARQMDITSMANYTPALISITLSFAELRLLGLTSQGVDEFYYFKAMTDGKALDWFESPQQQLEFIAALGGADEDQMIRYALDDVKQLPQALGELKKYWQSGDMEALYQSQGKSFNDDFPEIYQQLLVQRNENWLPAIEEMLTSAQTEFVLVGTMHLSGPDSVLDMLIKRGYSVQKL